MSEKKDPIFPTLKEHATETKQWLLLELIETGDVSTLQKRLCGAFDALVRLALVNHHYDQRVDDDAKMMARTILVSAQEQHLPWHLNPDERFKKLRDDGLLPKIAEVRADFAAMLLEIMTAQPLNGYALLETREYLLKNISFAWRYATDQTDADRYFNAVMSADRSMEKWLSMTEKALRDATTNEEPKVSSERLGLALRSKAADNIEESLRNVLKIAWVKSLHPEDFETHLNLQRGIDKRVS